MILFQQSGRPHLLEISSNCAWERSRPKLLARLSDLTKASDGYPRPCTMLVDGFKVEVQPKPKFLTEIPTRLRESLGMSSMFSIRVRITAEEKPLARTDSTVLPRSPAAVELCSVVRDSDNRSLGSACSDRRTVVDIINQKTNIDASGQNSDVDNIARPLAASVVGTRYGVQERAATAVYSSQQANAAVSTDQQQTNADATSQGTTANVCRHIESDLSTGAANWLNKDSTGVKKSSITDNILQTQLKLPSGPEAVGTAAQVGDIGCYDVNRHISASSCAYSVNTGSCATLQQRGADADMTRNVSSVDAECIDTVSSCLHADDGNFRSSPGLSVPIACSLDLCT